MKKKIAWITLISCALVLFGSLFWTMISGDPMPFIFGYPVAAILLAISYALRPVRLL